MKKWLKKHPRLSSVALVGGLLAAQLTGWLPLAPLARVVTRPAATPLTQSGLKVAGFFSDIFRLNRLSDENTKLQAENEALSVQLSSLREIEIANQQLRRQLNFASSHRLEGAGADVIGYQPDNIRQLVLINKGSQDGIKSGQPVMSAGCLVGVVHQTYHTTSEVMLVTDPVFRALVTAQAGRATGIVKGFGSASLNMERIPQNFSVQVGEIVITNGLDGSFPIGLPLGRVVSVEPAAEAIFQTAHVRPLIDLDQLQTVVVLRGN